MIVLPDGKYLITTSERYAEELKLLRARVVEGQMRAAVRRYLATEKRTNPTHLKVLNG